VPTLRPEQHPRGLFRRRQIDPVGGDQAPPGVAPARSCESTLTFSARRYRSRV